MNNTCLNFRMWPEFLCMSF